MKKKRSRAGLVFQALLVVSKLMAFADTRYVIAELAESIHDEG